jgi:tripartite-type tricarboxylate transporter receptor subunit TctC
VTTPALTFRRRDVVRLGLASLASSLAAPAFADEFPSKPIRMLLPYGAGGIGDVTARIITDTMSKDIGQPIVIDNKPGAGGVLAFQAALQQPADGYTLAMGGNGTAISQSLFKSLPYDILKDFTQVSAMSKFSLVVLVSPDSKYRTLADLVAWSKQNPGKLNLGSSSVGSTQHLAAELFKSVAGITGQVVPFKEAAGVYSALRSKDVDVAFEFLPPVLTQIKGGALKALAIASEKRNAILPDVPTAAEGGVRGFDVVSWNAVSVRAGTPPAIVDRLNKAFVKAINSKTVIEKLKAVNSEPYPLSPTETRALMTAEIARWKEVIERAGIQRT